MSTSTYAGPDFTLEIRRGSEGLAEGWLRMNDGRAYLLRGDETEIPWTTDGASAEWLERVTRREPDELVAAV